MDEFELRQIEEIHNLIHKIIGRMEAQRDFRPSLYFIKNDVLDFPTSENLKKGGPISEQGVVEFTEKEIQSMPKKIQRLIILNKKRCRLRTRQTGKNSVSYEIRLRRDGYEVTASGKTIELAKTNFLEKLKTAKPTEKENQSAVPTTFHSFVTYYFENFRKEKVTAQTFKNDLFRYKRNLKSFFKEEPLKKITPFQCKALLDRYKEKGLLKTADEIYSLMNVIFKCAIAHGIIKQNPLATVFHVQHVRKSGVALLREEENKIFSMLDPQYHQTVAVALYCGLRPNELKTAFVKGPFVVAVNSKRKNGKIEYKRIPISKRLKPFILKEGPLKLCNENVIRNELKKILPNHKLYDLRTTFYTRCKECDVSDNALKEFAGHSLGALGNAYTDLSDEYLLKEGKKLDQW